MESLSIFDIFKIGIGPSSSHTLGPWKAAAYFLRHRDSFNIDHVQIHLYGSLSKTGLGHATDKAIMLGLMGYDPETVETEIIDSLVDALKKNKLIGDIRFDPAKDLIFESFEHDYHPNTMKFCAFQNNQLIKEEYIMSIGGGFIEDPFQKSKGNGSITLPYPIQNGTELLRYTDSSQCSISEIVLKNEMAIRTAEEIHKGINQLIEVTTDCIYKGCSTEGTLPGGLNVKRRAKTLCEKLIQNQPFSSKKEWLVAIKKAPKDFNAINKWVSCFALAVNEENAAMGRIVTSPTNGAAGVIPAVLTYYMLFCDSNNDPDSIQKFLLTAGEIGCIFKKGATISAAVGGCQAEIGVSSAMAAAGLTEVLGGTPEQCMVAAEIAMEHHLGLTCDPIKGLVQVPCIERNAMGAIKAITAANLALETDPESTIVHLDTVVKTMWEVAQDMHKKYKETSDGGLAISLPVVNPNC